MGKMLVSSFIIAVVINSIFAMNYCDKSLCPPGRAHIGCGNNGAFGPLCQSAVEVIDISNMIDRIVDKHNELRNLIASGKLDNYKSAARMATITWDEELAHLALLHAKQCDKNHDQCHNTRQFKMSGQCLSWWIASSPYEADPGCVDSVVDWFDEYKNADNSVIQKLYDNRRVTAHFIQLVYEKNYKVGCAAVRSRSNGMYNYFVTCNYAAQAMSSQPVYEFGPPASKCKSGINPKYPALCSVNEKYDL